jgi:hypothetical protein
MIEIMDRKTLDNARDGIGEAWKQFGKVEFRKPWIYRKTMADRMGARPWFSGIVLFATVLAGIGAILYFRKRKQVANRYNMGEAETAGDSMGSPVGEGFGKADRREESFRSP